MKFLIVDDSKTMLRIVSNVVKQIGYDNSILAENGQEAWEKLQENKDVDIILTDINMPVLDGYGLMKLIKDDDTVNHIPIVAITTEGGKESVIKALKLGCRNYIIKPFSADTLKAKLLDIVGK